MLPFNAATGTAGDREAGATCPRCSFRIALGESVAVCPRCGKVSHRACWDLGSGCGSYECAPSHRDMSGDEPALKITHDELAHASPLPNGRPTFFSVAPPAPALPRWNRLAIAAFVCALAGIPLFGIVTGLVAVFLGCWALGTLRVTRQKGTVLAVVGVLLGLGDAAGWLYFLWTIFSNPGVNLDFADARPPSLERLAKLDPKIGRAMRANVLIKTNRGWGGSGIGSGVILEIADGEALIITNRHVIDAGFTGGAAEHPNNALDKLEFEVLLVDGSIGHGRAVWLAPGGIDLALVRAPCRSGEVRATKWRLKRPLLIGKPVFAIGNPLGLGWSQTKGSISQVRDKEMGGRQVSIIQTQAAINPGNSGGGLYDDDAFLVGITTWTQDKRVAEGLSFAIAFDVLADLHPPGLDLQAGSKEQEKP